MTFRTLTGHYFVFKFDLSLGIGTNIGKTEGIFINLQCDCHRVASVYIYKTDQSPCQVQHLVGRLDSAMNK